MNIKEYTHSLTHSFINPQFKQLDLETWNLVLYFPNGVGEKKLAVSMQEIFQILVDYFGFFGYNTECKD